MAYFQEDCSELPNLTIHTTCHIPWHLVMVTFFTWKLSKQRVFTGRFRCQLQSNYAFHTHTHTHTHIILCYTEYKIIVYKLKSHNYNNPPPLFFLESSKLETFNGGSLTLRLLNWDQQNRTLNRKKLETEEHYIWVIPCINTSPTHYWTGINKTEHWTGKKLETEEH